MTSYCLCTVVYPGAEKFIGRFFQNLRDIEEIPDSRIVVAVHGNVSLGDFEDCNIAKLAVGADCSPAAVRTELFYFLKKKTAHDVYVFSDIDDLLKPESFHLHSQALKVGDFSYGDQQLFGKDFSEDLGKTLFELFNPLEQITTFSPLLRGNYVGFSALALSRKVILETPHHFPENLTPLDWWLVCRMVLSGFKGQKTGIVTNYCSHQPHLEAFRPRVSEETLKIRIEQVQRLLLTLEDLVPEAITHFFGLTEKIDVLSEELNRNPHKILEFAKKILPEYVMWYEDVTILAENFQKEKSP